MVIFKMGKEESTLLTELLLKDLSTYHIHEVMNRVSLVKNLSAFINLGYAYKLAQFIIIQAEERVDFNISVFEATGYKDIFDYIVHTYLYNGKKSIHGLTNTISDKSTDFKQYALKYLLNPSILFDDWNEFIKTDEYIGLPLVNEEIRDVNIIGIEQYRYVAYSSGKIYDNMNGRFIQSEPDLKTGFIPVPLRTTSKRHKNFLMHLVIYEVFKYYDFEQAKEKKLFAIHKDGNIRNNWLYNIRFGTRKESMDQRKGNVSRIKR